ncbi:MAG: hypothetical protein MJZ93_07015 [Paludibacteraceae bacterium]|nr:hypothetical protein [Paludibacteraceae bacterium]
MKRIVLIIIAYTVTFSTYAYTPMLEKGKKWIYFAYEVAFPGKYYSPAFSVPRDTVINGYTYFITDFTDHLLREDTAARVVYLFDENENQEYTLYDFTLSVGDSACVYHPDSCTGFIYIDDIDTVFSYTNCPLRRYYYHYFPCSDDKSIRYTDNYVESCGRMSGLLSGLRSSANGEGLATFLRCVLSSDSMVIYKNHSKIADHVLDDDCYMPKSPNTQSKNTTYKESDRMFYSNDKQTVYFKGQKWDQYTLPGIGKVLYPAMDNSPEESTNNSNPALKHSTAPVGTDTVTKANSKKTKLRKCLLKREKKQSSRKQNNE